MVETLKNRINAPEGERIVNKIRMKEGMDRRIRPKGLCRLAVVCLIPVLCMAAAAATRNVALAEEATIQLSQPQTDRNPLLQLLMKRESSRAFGASEGLATVVRASIDRPVLAEAMKLRPNQRIILAQSVGYPKK